MRWAMGMRGGGERVGVGRVRVGWGSLSLAWEVYLCPDLTVCSISIYRILSLAVGTLDYM